MLSWPERFRMLARELGPLGEFNGHYRASMHCTGDRIDFIHNESVTFASIIKSEGSMFFIDDIASEADSRADGFQFDDLDSECLLASEKGFGGRCGTSRSTMKVVGNITWSGAASIWPR